MSGRMGSSGLNRWRMASTAILYCPGKRKGRGARQEIAFSGTRASLGLKSCRGASAGIRFCVGERVCVCVWGGGKGGMNLC